jgi:integrating conjugative element protein (TIGR03757 family)
MQFRPHTLLAALIIAATALSPAYAEAPAERLRVDVFTTEDRPIRGATEFLRHHPGATLHVHRVDHIERLEAEMSLNLSANPDKARRQALERLQNLPKERQEQLEQTAKGLALALQLGIERVPAIVIDQDRVIYGMTDLAAVLQHDQRLPGGKTR